jgi:hypothetical protein
LASEVGSEIKPSGGADFFTSFVEMPNFGPEMADSCRFAAENPRLSGNADLDQTNCRVTPPYDRVHLSIRHGFAGRAGE